MKVLSLLQPFASLIVIGAKLIETRTWATKFRGSLLIHASARFPKEYRELCEQEYFSDFVPDWKALPLGQIIGRAELADIVETETLNQLDGGGTITVGNDIWRIAKQELSFGNYNPNRFGWLLNNPVQFKNPLPAKGSLGLWEFPDHLLPENLKTIV